MALACREERSPERETVDLASYLELPTWTPNLGNVQRHANDGPVKAVTGWFQYGGESLGDTLRGSHRA
jgi:hypothetical protein